MNRVSIKIKFLIPLSILIAFLIIILNFTYSFLVVNNLDDIITEDNLSKIIFYGSIVFGLLIFLFFLRITGKLENELKERERELIKTNNELDNFTYIASHDLKAPLRAIESLAGWIEDDLEEVNDNTKSQLELLKGRVGRMNQLLDSLLEYSRIGKLNEEAVLTDTKKILDNILGKQKIPKGFRLNVAGEMPVFETYINPLNQIFYNLISNAVKHHDKSEGIITVKCHDNGKFYRFFVIDDGPGISSEYHLKIFNLFQTLKSKDIVEGAGMGLAIVQKILDFFGGRIKVKSKEGQGTSFIFDWPKKF